MGLKSFFFTLLLNTKLRVHPCDRFQNESISDYAFGTSSLPLLPPANEEQQSHHRQTTAAIESHMHTEDDQR